MADGSWRDVALGDLVPIHPDNRNPHVVAALKLGVSVDVDVSDFGSTRLCSDKLLSLLAQPAPDPGVDLHEDRFTAE